RTGRAIAERFGFAWASSGDDVPSQVAVPGGWYISTHFLGTIFFASASVERLGYFLDYDVSRDRVCSIGSPHEPVGSSSTLAPRSASSGRAPSSPSTSSSGCWTKATGSAAGSSREPVSPSTPFAAT